MSLSRLIRKQKELTRDLRIDALNEHDIDSHSSYQASLQYSHKHSSSSNPRYMISKASIMRDSSVVLLNEDVVSIDTTPTLANTSSRPDHGANFVNSNVFSPTLSLTSSSLTEV